MTAVAEPESALEIEPVETTKPHRRFLAFILHPSSLIVLLTLLGAVLRFMYLDQPALWGDESQTFRRICGDFQTLLDQLAVAGFAPLHYLLYWWIGQQTPLTPVVMRLPVAIAGTLMVPAMYFLAAQVVSRRTAVLVAAFTACSAYMLNYSRDAKMYAETWLFVALNVACLLWWLRARTRISWWAWVCSGVLMLGFHMVSALVLPIELIIVLTARNPRWRSLGVLVQAVFWLPVLTLLSVLQLVGIKRVGDPNSVFRWFRRTFVNFHWPPVVFFVLGVALIGIGPYIYYAKFNIYVDRVYNETSDRLNWQRTGINWVGPYNMGRDGLGMLRYTATAFAYNWEWPRQRDEPFIRERTLKLLKAAGVALLAVVMLGALPWTTSRAGGSPRSVFWLAAWVLLPAYGFYAVSELGAVWPVDWVALAVLRKPPAVAWPALPSPDLWGAATLPALLRGWRDAATQFSNAFTIANTNWWVIASIGFLTIVWLVLPPYEWSIKARRALRGLGVLAAVFLLCTILRFCVFKTLPDSVWMPRYLGVIWPAFAILLCLLIMRLPTRPLRWSAIALLLIVNLAQHGARVFAGSEPPTDRIARDVVEAQPPDNTSRVYYRIRYRGAGDPGSGMLETPPGRYYLAVLSGRSVAPLDLIRGFPNENRRAWPEVWYARGILPPESFVPASLKTATNIRRIVLWDQLDPGQVDMNDRLLENLSPDWKRTSDEVFQVRDHWTWRELVTARRRVYERR